MREHIIETFDLTKFYKLKGGKEITALNKANIYIDKGEIFGLLGPNGAGKTTMIQILTTLLTPTSGYAIVDGHNVVRNPKKAKSNISLMLEDDMLYYRMTGYANLKFFCKIYGVQNYKEKIYRIAKEFDLEKWLDQYVEHFSSGMKMKLALCRTLLLNREILFLDEPTLGLDVKSISFIVKKLKDINKTIFLTSHDMGVVEKLCDRIAFINQGKILKIGTKEDVKGLGQSGVRIKIEIKGDKKDLKNELNQTNFVNEIDESNKELIIYLKNRKYYNSLLSILTNFEILKIQEQDVSLESLFLNLA